MLPKGYKAKNKDNINIKYDNYIVINDKDKALDFINTSKAKKQVEIVKDLLEKGANKIYRIKRKNNLHSEEELIDDRIIEIYNMNEIKD